MKKRISIHILFIIVVTLLLNSCQVSRFVFYNFSDIKDYEKFHFRSLQGVSSPFIFAVATPTDETKFVNDSIEKLLKNNNTIAFIVVKNDTIQYEKYFGNYNRQSIVPSFSMAKSVLSILIGCAIDDGYIQSVDEPITNYIPELLKNGFDKVTIKHLLQMTSGLSFKESNINPFGKTAAFYYGLHLKNRVLKMKLKTSPGEQFEYVSGNTQLLGLLLERSLKDKTITQYLQEKIWTPLGMENNASWSIDQKKNGIEKTFCCLNATAIDFAKIGRLYKSKGNWDGKQIVSQNWVNESTKLDTSDASVSYYQYHWWLPTPNEDFMAQGHLGQYIYVNPTKDLIIVRLGSNEGKLNWWSFFTSFAKHH
ncbi:MAG: serine hydrolase [Flavobacteriaceae bacterium]|nr:serine hydrolase [Flavobacteriaceae bacterium]